MAKATDRAGATAPVDNSYEAQAERAGRKVYELSETKQLGSKTFFAGKVALTDDEAKQLGLIGSEPSPETSPTPEGATTSVGGEGATDPAGTGDQATTGGAGAGGGATGTSGGTASGQTSTTTGGGAGGGR